MMLGTDIVLLEAESTEIQESGLRKRAKCLVKCKENVWKGRKSEDLRSPGERHSSGFYDKGARIQTGDVVIIREARKNSGV